MFENFPDIVMVSDLQEMMGIGRTTAYKLIASGKIKSVRVGNAIRIPKRFIIDYILGIEYNEHSDVSVPV